MRFQSLTGKLVLVAILVTLASTAIAGELTSYKEALAKAKAENKMLVIDFYTDW
jgi:hypothetical protein